MPNQKLNITELVIWNTGYVKLSINSKEYEYDFPARETYDSLKRRYRNKGIFLNKIKLYQRKNENTD